MTELIKDYLNDVKLTVNEGDTLEYFIFANDVVRYVITKPLKIKSTIE